VVKKQYTQIKNSTLAETAKKMRNNGKTKQVNDRVQNWKLCRSRRIRFLGLPWSNRRQRPLASTGLAGAKRYAGPKPRPNPRPRPRASDPQRPAPGPNKGPTKRKQTATREREGQREKERNWSQKENKKHFNHLLFH
jgi:hypothetical protein